jgi:hypothetical protein
MNEREFSDLDGETIQLLMSLGISEEQLAALKEDKASAQAIIDSGMPEGRSNGRVYTAANPLEFIAQGVRAYKADKDIGGTGSMEDQLAELAGTKMQNVDPGLDAQRQHLLNQQVQGRGSYFNLLRGPQAAAPPAATPPSSTPPLMSPNPGPPQPRALPLSDSQNTASLADLLRRFGRK